MKKYDFDNVVNRRGTNCYKWDDGAMPEDIIPMWVADMDFSVAPEIQRALKDRVEHGVFGYAMVPESYYEAIISWFGRRHNWAINKEWIIYTTGVVPAVSATIKALAMPGERILMQTPAYNCFFSSIRNQGCLVEETPLLRKGDTYVMDWDDFERRCADEKVVAFLLCNPHNPAGRVWTKEELLKMNEICMEHNVRVVSDEIHCELVMPGHRFTPFASVSNDCLNNSVTLNSPTKNFNLAGLQIANIICSDAELRRRINRAINIFEVCDVNPFGPIALEAAYNKSEDWIDELNNYLFGNYNALKEFFAQNIPAFEVLRLEGTYLVWVDIRNSKLTSDELIEFLFERAHVRLNSGTMYGQSAGEGYIRINIATSRLILMEALQRISQALQGVS